MYCFEFRASRFEFFVIMRKNVFGRQFKRDANERKALFKNLLTSLVLHERITTTPAKAKAIRSAADKLITKAKRGGDDALRLLAPDVRHEVAMKLINDLAPLFVNRQGGYTRIIKLGKNRVADNAPQVLMEWVERPVADLKLKTKNKEQKNAKKEVKPKKEVKVEKDAEVKVDTKKAEKETKVASNAPKTTKKEVKAKKAK
jgi:large subunit ribosomal protein L17